MGNDCTRRRVGRTVAEVGVSGCGCSQSEGDDWQGSNFSSQIFIKANLVQFQLLGGKTMFLFNYLSLRLILLYCCYIDLLPFELIIDVNNVIYCE